MDEHDAMSRRRWPDGWKVRPCGMCGAPVGKPCLNASWDERQTPHKSRPIACPACGAVTESRPLCAGCTEAEDFEEAIYADPCDDCGAKPCRCDDLPNDETPPENA